MEVTEQQVTQWLENVDAINGSRMAQVYAVAKQLAPILTGTIVYPDSPANLRRHNLSVVGETWHYEDGTAVIFMGDEVSEYGHYVSGYLKHGFAAHKQVLRQACEPVTEARMVDIILAHELGHVLLHRQAIANGIDIFVVRASRSDPIWGLPLALHSTVAMDAWRYNRGGYRTYLERVGYDSYRFFTKVIENAKAYRELPDERDCDNFALEVIQVLYPLS